MTVREALPVLEAQGLVEIRVGARGGAFVTAPSSRFVGEGIDDLMTLASLTGVEVTEARQVFELGIVYVQSAHNRSIAMLVESLHGPLLMSLERAREVAPCTAGTASTSTGRWSTPSVTGMPVARAR